MNVLEMLNARLTDEVIGPLARQLGESAAETRKVLLNGAVPAVLTGLAQTHADAGGVERLDALLKGAGHDGAVLDDLPGALGGGARTDALASLGKGQLEWVLPGRFDAVANQLAAWSGLRRASALTLLGLAVPLVLAALGKSLPGAAIAGDAVAGMLAEAQRSLGADPAPGLPEILSQPLAGTVTSSPAPHAERRPAIWPWLLVPAITLLVFFSLRSCQELPTRDSPPPAGIRPPA
jgi:hypothetical protein